MEELLRKILFDERIKSLVSNKIYLLKAPDDTLAPYICLLYTSPSPRD